VPAGVGATESENPGAYTFNPRSFFFPYPTPAFCPDHIPSLPGQDLAGAEIAQDLVHLEIQRGYTFQVYIFRNMHILAIFDIKYGTKITSGGQTQAPLNTMDSLVAIWDHPWYKKSRILRHYG